MASSKANRENWTISYARAEPNVTNEIFFKEKYRQIGSFVTQYEMAVLLEGLSLQYTNRPKDLTIYVMRGDNTVPAWENARNYIGGSIEMLAQLKHPDAVLKTLASSLIFAGMLDADKPDVDRSKLAVVNGFHIKIYERDGLSGVRIVIWVDDVRKAMFKDINEMPLVRDLQQLFVKEFNMEIDAVQFQPHFNRSSYDFDVIVNLGLIDELLRVRAEYKTNGLKVSHRDAVDGERLPRAAGIGDKERRPRDGANGSGAGRGNSPKNGEPKPAAPAADTPRAPDTIDNNTASSNNGQLNSLPVETKRYGQHNGDSLVNGASRRGGGGGSVGNGTAAQTATGTVANGTTSNFGFTERGRFDMPPNGSTHRGGEDPADWNPPAPRHGIGFNNNTRHNDSHAKVHEEWVANNSAGSRQAPIDDAELLGDAKPRSSVNTATQQQAAGGMFGFAKPSAGVADVAAETTSVLRDVSSSNVAVGRGRGGGRGAQQHAPSADPPLTSRLASNESGTAGAGRGGGSSVVVGGGGSASVTGAGRGSPVKSMLQQSSVVGAGRGSPIKQQQQEQVSVTVTTVRNGDKG